MIIKKTVDIGQLDFVSRAVSYDEHRYCMNTCCYDREQQSLVATDGRRLHIWRGAPDMFPEVVPDRQQYAVIVGKDTIEGKELEGVFPNYRRVIPEDYTLVRRDISLPKKTKKTANSLAESIANIIFTVPVNCFSLMDCSPFTWDIYTAKEEPESKPLLLRSTIDDEQELIAILVCIR